jgi:hypothetical protein
VVDELPAWTLERGEPAAAVTTAELPSGSGGETLDAAEDGVLLLDFRLLPPRRFRKDMLIPGRAAGALVGSLTSRASELH